MNRLPRKPVECNKTCRACRMAQVCQHPKRPWCAKGVSRTGGPRDASGMCHKTCKEGIAMASVAPLAEEHVGPARFFRRTHRRPSCCFPATRGSSMVPVPEGAVANVVAEGSDLHCLDVFVRDVQVGLTLLQLLHHLSCHEDSASSMAEPEYQAGRGK